MSESELNSPETTEKDGGEQINPETDETQATPDEATEQAPMEELDSRDAVIAALLEEKNQLTYQVAELQNIIRRTKTQAETDRKFAAERLVVSLLPVLDGFERTLAAAAKGASVESLSDGVRVVDKQMRKALEGSGLTRLVSLGAPFDPIHHEALDTVENAELDEDTVVDEIEAGYVMHGRTVRPAKVRVSRKP